MLIAGPTVFICDECIARCQEIIEQGNRKPGDVRDPSAEAKSLFDWFSRYSAWWDVQSKVQRAYVRRFGLYRYSLTYFGLKRRQMLLLRWFAALIGAPPGTADEYSPQSDGGRWSYTRGTERLYCERRVVLYRPVVHIVITQPDGTESAEEFSDIGPALDRERELDRGWTKEGWRRSETA